MKYEIGDVVKCPSSGPHAGPRIGKIKYIPTNADGIPCVPVEVGYIDYPNEFPGGWFCLGAKVKPLGIILKRNHNN